MTKSLLVASAAVAIVAAAAVGTSQAGASGPAIFTAAQVSAGAKTYGSECSRCHGANLQGVSAPALRGTGSGLGGDSVGEAYTFISTQMPAGNPGSLSSSDYTNVLSFILSKNGHAPGSTALTPGIAAKSKLKI